MPIRWPWIALAAVAAGAAGLGAARFDVLLPRGDVSIEPASVRAFRIDRDRTLLVARRPTDPVPFVLLVNRREQFVGRPVAFRGRWVGSLLLWDRGAYSSVWLRDRVKLGEGPDYRFLGQSVAIDWPAPGDPVAHIRLTFAG